MEHADFEKIAVDAARQWLSSSESEHALTGEKPFVPTYLNNCRNNTWHPHAWVVNAVKEAYLKGLVANPKVKERVALISNDEGQPFADEADSFLIEAAYQRGFVIADDAASVLMVHEADLKDFVREAQKFAVEKALAGFKNQEKIDDEKTQTSVEKPSGLENPVVDAARRAVADTVIHEAFVLALTMRDDPENVTATKDHFVELVQAAVAPPADFDTSFMIAAVEDYHQGVQQHMVRAAVAAVLEAEKSIKKEVRGWPRGQGPVTVTINLDAQATIWDRKSLTSAFNPDDSITYTLKNKEPL